MGPSRSVGTVVVVDLPKTVSPHRYRLLQLVDWQVGYDLQYYHDE